VRTYKTSHIESVEKAMLSRLTEKDAITLRALSKQLRCSYFAAKRRLNAWCEEHDIMLGMVTKREGESGPASRAYYVQLK
jgi:hypothetical protein